MGHCIAYTAGAITFMGIGALITGVTLYFAYPTMISPDYVDPMPRYAICNLQSADGSASPSGLIKFNQTSMDDDIKITGTVVGLSLGPHGFHIHQYGVTDGVCTSTGSHYNPDNNSHGGPETAFRHVGDLGNVDSVEANGQFQTEVDIDDDIVTLYGDKSVVGRSIVIHEGEDDLGASGDAAGAAGGRVACCTIYLAPSI